MKDSGRNGRRPGRKESKSAKRSSLPARQHSAKARTKSNIESSERRDELPQKRSLRISLDRQPRNHHGELTRITISVYRFLQREQAHRAWFIFVSCVAFAALPWTAHLTGLRQGAIVLASISAAAIFMPDLSSKLWHLDAHDIREMVPLHRRRAFYAQLIRADCPEEEWADRWAKLVWRQGVMPLLDAAQDTSRIHWDVRYEASVHLGVLLNIGGRVQQMARVETRHDFDCLLPGTNNGELWVSVAGNDASLRSEYNEKGCLSRELVRLPGLSKQRWVEEVRRLCDVRVEIGENGENGSRSIEFSEEDVVEVTGDDDPWIVRWLLPGTRLTSGVVRVPWQIEIDFPTKVRENNFPLLLAGYYCAGKTSLSFRFYHNNRKRPTLRYFGEFLSEGGSNVVGWKPDAHRSDERQSVTYRTRQDSLLWPGSGIYCWWESE